MLEVKSFQGKKNICSIWIYTFRKLKMEAKNCRWFFSKQTSASSILVFLGSVQIHVYPQKRGITKKIELTLHSHFRLKFQTIPRDKGFYEGALFCFKRCILPVGFYIQISLLMLRNDAKCWKNLDIQILKATAHPTLLKKKRFTASKLFLSQMF